ncbi:MAG: L-histidine N(alpha)-methyltransferase [Nostoc sp. DedVER02]|uniref:L-histidine N(alpha)-methyltransferase n=1 Tax=unclassified Nostoc TaxID=2593658 RepID=UPI002AD3C592|nr:MULTISPECIES: L-histidine N(alpha)-methyltransferase [unclassified Nostoc]MDZ7990519.1 L-histidine N(alpha)-methyltransferase [Nostoc sp. DedVER02]MDZ8113877.1 L-histidine N(alpha)-methyltransferase [Nostoc sp. DedVER01b]
MAQIFHNNSQLPSDNMSTAINRTAKPSSEFYSIFSEEEIVEVIHALEVKREIPLKYSYKGRGAKIWDNFYRKYVIPRWYRTSNIEIDLLNENFNYFNSNIEPGRKITIVDVGAGNSYPVKKFIYRLNKLKKVNKYIALDISEELLNVSQNNLKKWFPLIEFISSTIDIENHSVPITLFQNKADIEIDNTAKIFFHLGVTIGNHQNRHKVFKNFRDSMGKNDYLVFTNEIGSNSTWDGNVRGGCKYHVEEIYEWVKNKIGIKSEDCELVRKYDLKTDSIIANIKLHHDYTISFDQMGIDKSIEISEGEEITIWRHHKFEIPQLLQELESSGLQLIQYSIDKYKSHIMVICRVAIN